jgi:hypothetical protein
MRALRYMSFEGHLERGKRVDTNTFIIALAIMFAVYIVIRLLMKR